MAEFQLSSSLTKSQVARLRKAAARQMEVFPEWGKIIIKQTKMSDNHYVAVISAMDQYTATCTRIRAGGVFMSMWLEEVFYNELKLIY